MKSVLRDTLFLAPAVAMWGIVGYLALRWPTDWWAAGLCTFAGFVLFTAILAAIFRGGATRAFWTGFAAFGLSYGLIVGVPGLREGMRPLLVPSPLLYHLYVRWNPPPTDPNNPPQAVVSTSPGAPAASTITLTAAANASPNTINYLSFSPSKTPVLSQLAAAPGGADPALFENIGEALATLFIALVGGIAGRFLESAQAGRSRGDRPADGASRTEVTHEAEALSA